MIQLEKNKDIIKTLLKSINRERIDVLIRALEKSDFFVAPASTIYHLNCPGGLAYHSLKVYNTLKTLNDAFNIGLPDETIKIVGLLHDVCKINIYGWNAGANRYYKKSKAPKEHGLRSVQMLKQCIQLTEKEEYMIRWHMHKYTWDGDFKANEDDIKKKHPEAYLAYFADHLSTLFLEEE